MIRPGRAVITTMRWESRIASWRLCVTKTTVFRVRAQMPEEPLAHEEPRLLVERAERLVHEEDRRVEGERAGDGHALLHPARELARVARLEPAEPDGLEERPGALAPGLAAGTPWSSSPNSTFSSAVRHGKEPGVLEDHRHLARVGAG